MAFIIRPAGLSDDDDDSDSDDYGFYEKPARRHYPVYYNDTKKKIEISLQDAVINGNLNEVETIITRDLNNNVNSKLDSGWTPLMHSCFHAQDAIVNYLLNNDADPNLHSDSVTPIMAACSNSSAPNEAIYSIVNNLIAKGSSLNVGDKYGQTPLMRAIGSGRVSVVQKLLEKKVNIEMRDQQGWTALFWAAHHNQLEILEILIADGARLTEIDKSGRSVIEIAESHGYDNIIEVLDKHIKKGDDGDESNADFYVNNQIRSWQNYYPGINEKPNYKCEIPHMLYGMNCERLTPIIENSGMDLRTFLLLEEGDMIKLGIDLPYERQRLKYGLHNFHTKGWKLSAVSGLYARRKQNYSVLDCLTTLSTHLLQIYILETTLQYALRHYSTVQEQIKFEPADSTINTKFKAEVKNIITNINSIRREIKNLKLLLTKISRNNPPPADLITDKSINDKALSYVTKLVVGLSVGIFIYHAKVYVCNMLNK